MISAAFILLVCVGVVGLTVYSNLLVYLKRKHREVWESLGSPSLFLNNTIANGFRTQSFLLRRKYATLNDPSLVKKGDRLIFVYYSYFFLFICLLVLVLVQIFRQ